VLAIRLGSVASGLRRTANERLPAEAPQQDREHTQPMKTINHMHLHFRLTSPN
jgi:hypothetical protein